MLMNRFPISLSHAGLDPASSEWMAGVVIWASSGLDTSLGSGILLRSYFCIPAVVRWYDDSRNECSA
ncbi:MAG: hypothetical protein H8E21_01795 [Gammaproteobacteria bacterium]|nr:hypothetical protein [Gammaproteobacteria bacterium]MBL6998856.1 hypothetical protein [Gammaproteobacteria bacterium]